MATISKNFKIKQGLVVEGTTGTINGFNILTESQDSQDFIIDIIGGETLITSVESTQLEVLSGELNVKSGVFDAYGAADEAYSNAQTYASSVASSYADTAYSNAISESAANAFAEAQFALGQATAYADGLASNYDASGSAATAYANATSYTDSAVAGLVDSAPELLNTLNELAAAIGDDANFATTLTNLVGTKQDVLTAGNGIDISGNTISVAFDAGNGLAINGTNLTVDTNVIATQTYASSVASSAQDSAESYASSVAYVAYSNALSEANSYTDSAISGIDLSYTTDDVTEGSNLYFTDQRALDAITNATIYPTMVEINNYRKEEATWTSVATASKATCHSAASTYGSMKYLVRVTASVGGTIHSHVTEVLATVDGENNVAVLEYGTIYTSTSSLATVTVEWNSGTSNYDLNVTTANNNSEVMVAATLLDAQD